jgi:VIT1/CCC1 family predicted Fe2+/Mn2+ transporter
MEAHFTGGQTVRDIVIGMSDGLTVPFALAAGITGAIANTHVVVVAGLAEIAAGSIAMGLGGYLAAKSEAEHYATERLREVREVKELPEEEAAEVARVFESYGLDRTESEPIVAALRARPTAWVDFMMRFELGLEEPDPKRARVSAATIGASYVGGGIIPLAPYMLLSNAHAALLGSIIVTLIALAVFGYIKGRFTGLQPFRSASQTLVIGALAATAAFLLARLFS